MVSNIDIFQGIVSKLEIPVSWQHYSAICNTMAIPTTDIHIYLILFKKIYKLNIINCEYQEEMFRL